MSFNSQLINGSKGYYSGYYMGNGLRNLSIAIGGVGKGNSYVIGSPPKVGKTTLVDNGFLIGPYEYAISNNKSIEILYFSFEIDDILKQFDLVCHYIYKKHKIDSIKFNDRTYKGLNTVPISSNLLMGRLLCDNNKPLTLSESVRNNIKKVHEDYVQPLLRNNCTIIEERLLPKDFENYILNHALRNGKFEGNNYIPNDPSKLTIVIIDHIRKFISPKGYNLKQTIDEVSNTIVTLRNKLKYAFATVVHTNRSLSDHNNMKFYGDRIFPTAEQIKESGNLSEDSTHVLTMFNPNDDRYNLKTHFGMKIKNNNGDMLYPNLRTIHLVECRFADSPQHFKTLMRGNVKTFETF